MCFFFFCVVVVGTVFILHPTFLLVAAIHHIASVSCLFHQHTSFLLLFYLAYTVPSSLTFILKSLLPPIAFAQASRLSYHIIRFNVFIFAIWFLYLIRLVSSHYPSTIMSGVGSCSCISYSRHDAFRSPLINFVPFFTIGLEVCDMVCVGIQI